MQGIRRQEAARAVAAQLSGAIHAPMRCLEYASHCAGNTSHAQKVTLIRQRHRRHDAARLF